MKIITFEEFNSCPEARRVRGNFIKYSISGVLADVQGELCCVIFDSKIKSEDLKKLEAGLNLYVVICLWPKGSVLDDLEFIDPIQRVITRQELGSAQRTAEALADNYAMVSVYEILPDGGTKFIDTYSKGSA